MRKKVIFLCTHNSARSQMAEALVNYYWKDQYQAYSAGTEPGKVNPYAVKAMEEIGIDISAARSKNASEFIGKPFDLVITVCDNAKQNCPFFPGAKEYIHKSFEDPSEAKGNEKRIFMIFRKTRDEIHIWLKGILK